MDAGEKKATLSTTNRVISPREKITRRSHGGGGGHGFVSTAEDAMMKKSRRTGEAAPECCPPPAMIYDTDLSDVTAAEAERRHGNCQS